MGYFLVFQRLFLNCVCRQLIVKAHVILRVAWCWRSTVWWLLTYDHGIRSEQSHNWNFEPQCRLKVSKFQNCPLNRVWLTGSRRGEGILHHMSRLDGRTGEEEISVWHAPRPSARMQTRR